MVKTKGRYNVFVKIMRDKMRMDIFSMFALLVIIFVVCCAVIVPMSSSHGYNDMDLSLKNLPPTKQFWFGTDGLGRDLFTRVWYGARLSVSVGICVAVIGSVFGMTYGVISGVVGGLVDEVMMRVVDIIHSVPTVLMSIMVMYLLGSGFISLTIAMSFAGWLEVSRIARGHVLQVKQSDFVSTAYIFGAGKCRIIWYHLLPNIARPVVTTAVMMVPIAIFFEAFFGFLGMGIQPPYPSLGTLVREGLITMRYYPWHLFIPASVIGVTTISFNVLGEKVVDVIDGIGT